MLFSDFIAEEVQIYYDHQSKHYEEHKDEEEHAEIWVEVHKHWCQYISGSKDTSSKVMVSQVISCRDALHNW